MVWHDYDDIPGTYVFDGETRPITSTRCFSPSIRKTAVMSLKQILLPTATCLVEGDFKECVIQKDFLLVLRLAATFILWPRWRFPEALPYRIAVHAGHYH